MPTTRTVKLLMAGLFIAAGLVVARVGILISKTFDNAHARLSTEVAIDYHDSNDFDHDGLSNSDEALWGSDPYNPDSDGDGFLDGEEVWSGHSPVQVGNDSLASINEFLSLSSTQRLAQVITGGILSGDLRRDSKQFASAVNTTATATVYSVLSALENIDLKDAVTNVIEDSHESEEEYLKNIFSVISEDLINIAFNQPKELVLLFSPNQNDRDNLNEVYDGQEKERIKSKFLQHAAKFQQAFEKMEQTPVPKSWVEIHQQILTLLKKLENYHRSIALSTDDPLKLMMVLGNLQNVYLEAQPIMVAIDVKIKSQKLTVPDNNFFNTALFLAK